MNESGGVSLIACWFILGVVVVSLLMQGGVLSHQGKATTVQPYADRSSTVDRSADGLGK